jgi:hypothetical protein
LLADTSAANTLVANTPLAGRTTLAPGGSAAILAEPSAIFSSAENPETVVSPATHPPLLSSIAACNAVILLSSFCDTKSQSEFAETTQVKANMITIEVMYVAIVLVMCYCPRCPSMGFTCATRVDRMVGEFTPVHASL